jgi:hypothetical protein
MEIIKHSSHEHVLSLSEKKREEEVLCKACSIYCVGPTFSCRESKCRFNLHESCAKLPQELHNPLLHPHPHPLSLVYLKHGMFGCKACRKISGGFTFRCEKDCNNVNFDVKCAFIRPAIEETGEPVPVHFTHHEHPLVPLENMPGDRISCRVCGTYCSNPTYGCFPCRYFLHRSCFKLPQEIFHPFHPYHPLTLKPRNPLEDVVVRCNACRNDIRYLHQVAYVCEYTNCRFRLHRECTSVIMTAITYEGHDHLLQFNHNIRKTKRGEDELIKYCSACKSPCESYGFSCLYCDFNLHHTCGPLPSTIKHKSHIHPLILTNSPAQHEDDQTHDEFYCDACEEERPDHYYPFISA